MSKIKLNTPKPAPKPAKPSENTKPLERPIPFLDEKH